VAFGEIASWQGIPAPPHSQACGPCQGLSGWFSQTIRNRSTKAKAKAITWCALDHYFGSRRRFITNSMLLDWMFAQRSTSVW
jgi:hypothetical protein